MKKRLTSILLILCMMLTLLPTAALAADTDTATPSKTNFVMNGKPVSVTAAYSINNTNYLQLRAIAAMLNGTAAQFDIGWDGQYAVIEPGKPYSGAITETKLQNTANVRQSSTKFKLNREIFTFSDARLIDGDTNYLQLREFAQKLSGTAAQFNLYWDAAAGKAVLEPGKPYDKVDSATPPAPTTATTPKVTGEDWTTFKDGSSYGYKDAAGKVVIPAQFKQANKFSQGIALVCQGDTDLYAYIDTTGKLITPSKYYGTACGKIVYEGLMRVGAFGDDITSALMKGERLDYIESEGGKTKVVLKGGKVFNYSVKEGFIDTTGKEVIPLQFDQVQSFQDGMAAVYQYKGVLRGTDIRKVGWIDTTGKMVIPYMSDDAYYYDGSVHSFKDGLVCYFVETDKDPFTLPLAGIMDKTGKVIIPAKKDEWFHSAPFGLLWRDGVIAVSPYKETNAQGVPTKGGGRKWSFSAMYDYSGKLIKDLVGYVWALPIGGGYVLAQHQLPSDVSNCYWSVFDRTGKMVVDQAESNNFFLINQPNGIINGYVYFGNSIYELSSGKKVKNPGIYVVAAKDAAYRTEPDGKILGNFPQNEVVWLVEKLSNGYSKVLWNGKEYYAWSAKLIEHGKP